MRRALLPTVALLLTGCLSAREKAWIGTWEEVGGVRYRFEQEGGDVVLTHAIDRDGEVLDVLQSEWHDGVMGLTWRVPSTGYVVTCTSADFDPTGRATLAWTSRSPEQTIHSGSEVIRRVE